MEPAFSIDRNELEKNKRVLLGSWVDGDLSSLSRGISGLSGKAGSSPVQKGRVIVLRYTDGSRMFSSLKASFYHSNYDDMFDGDRFVKRIASRHHSYEAIRGENIMFLFVGVSKLVYDSLTTFTSGRPTRICGGFHHSVPWGIELPLAGADSEFAARNMARAESVVRLAQKQDCDLRPWELEVARQELPLCHLMAPFLLEFSVESLVCKVFKQRLWEQGARKRETFDVVHDMWECCTELDEELFRQLRNIELT